MECVAWDGYYYGVDVSGGQLNRLTNLYGASPLPTSGTAAPADSCHMRFRAAQTSGGTQQCYTVEVAQFSFSGSGTATLGERCQSIIRVENSDGLHFSNGYMAHAGDALVILEPKDSVNVAALSFGNVYFDGVSVTPLGVRAYQANASNTASISVGSGCFIGQFASSGVLSGAAVTSNANFAFTGVRFSNITGYAISTGASTAIDVNVNGCAFNNSGGGIRVQGGNSLCVAGNSFSSITDVASAGIRVENTVSQVAVTGNTFKDVTPLDFSNTGTIGALVVSGNSTDSTSSVLNGSRFTNTNSTDPEVLDYYAEGTFTPTITFGGNAVNVTYTSQAGFYTRIGNRVLFNLAVILSSKGSSTGGLRIGGLPFVAAELTPVSLRVTNFTSGVGDTMLSAHIPASSQSPQIDKQSSGNTVQLTEADLGNTANIRLAGEYRVA
jgi:hypothetical protein